MIPGLWEEFKTSKKVLDNLGNLREKLTNSRILELFELSPDMLATFHRHKTLTKRFCLYSTLPREGQSVQILHTPVSRALNTAVSHQSNIHYILSEVIHQYGSYNSCCFLSYRY